MSLEARLGGVRLPNPTVLCSGYLGVSAGTLSLCAKAGAGAVASKSCCLKERKGHELPAVIYWENTVMNAVGLSNPGAENMVSELKEFKKANPGTPLIASAFEDSPEHFAEIAAKLEQAKPDIIELNFSCPNVEKCLFTESPDAARKAVEAVKNAVKTPVFAKLAPNVSRIGEIAKVCADAGADGITAVNSLGPGLKIDIRARKPILSNKFGGVSGPAIKPIAVRCVYEVRKAVGPDLPIIGMGGIVSGEDAVEFFMAGADAVGIGSALIWEGLGAFRAVGNGIESFMKENGFKKLSDMRMEE